jgi:hypothetical protein
MSVTRRHFITSATAVLATASIGLSSALAAEPAIFSIGDTLDGDRFDALLLWSSARKAFDVTIRPGMPVIAQIDNNIVRITDRALTRSEAESVVRRVYGDDGIEEIASGFMLDPVHEVRTAGQLGVRRYRLCMSLGRHPAWGGNGIDISVLELSAKRGV